MATRTDDEYERQIERLREEEFPMLKGATYLDHAGTTLYPKSLIDAFASVMTSTLLGNPHSMSLSSQTSTMLVENVRRETLRWFNADPEHFDLVFVQNATAGMKLLAECLQAYGDGYWIGYHKDAHTSLVGMRELSSAGSRCFASDEEVLSWIGADRPTTATSQTATRHIELFAYPAQSNMNGRRLPLDWCTRIRRNNGSGRRYTLLDAASLVSTAKLDLSDPDKSPDFTVLSFYKIFGFPDLGAMIVRKQSSNILHRRRYFGGGTVDAVVALQEQWHASKKSSIHEMLEDGTLPIHNIAALGCALTTYKKIFSSLSQNSDHVNGLTRHLYDLLCSLQHGNGRKVCKIYKDTNADYTDPATQGPIIAFNLKDSEGMWISNFEVEKVASIQNIHLRTGGVCNPGGVASALELAPWEIEQNFSSGFKCGTENDIVNGKPTGIIRVSLGAMSTRADVERLVEVIDDFFVDHSQTRRSQPPILGTRQEQQRAHYYVESLMIYPIKSCGGWSIPRNQPWTVYPEGLQWDREWCLVHEGTGNALSQKQHPRMALLRPSVDLAQGVLRVRFDGHAVDGPREAKEITVPLSADPRPFDAGAYDGMRDQPTQVCEDRITARRYAAKTYSSFFTKALGVPCQLARFPAAGKNSVSVRHSKLDMHPGSGRRLPGARVKRPILLSNESPILTISRPSLNRLNEQIKARGGKAAQAAVFRANMVVAQKLDVAPGMEQAYVEDGWEVIQVGQQLFEMLGSCRRCQMVCVDQETAEKNEEPFSTLAKTRRHQGKVWFGQHTCYLGTQAGEQRQQALIKTGDEVRVLEAEEARRVRRQHKTVAASSTT